MSKSIWHLFAIGIFVSIFNFLILFGQEARTIIFNPSDREILLPAYFSSDITIGLTGTIKLKVYFNKGQVESIEVLSTELKSETDMADRFPGLVTLTRDRIIHTVRKWNNYFVSPFSTDLMIVLAQDPSLSANNRSYLIEYGSHGEINKLTILGPRPENLK